MNKLAACFCIFKWQRERLTVLHICSHTHTRCVWYCSSCQIAWNWWGVRDFPVMSKRWALSLSLCMFLCFWWTHHNKSPKLLIYYFILFHHTNTVECQMVLLCFFILYMCWLNVCSVLKVCDLINVDNVLEFDWIIFWE